MTPRPQLNAYGPRTKFVGAHPYAAMLAAKQPKPRIVGIKERTLQAITDTPGITTGDLTRIVGGTGGAMRHRLDRMTAKGLVRDEKRTVYRQGGSSPVSHWFLPSHKGFQA